MSSAHPPFDSWPAQLVDARFGRAWFAEPAVFINQLDAARGTVEAVNGLHDAIDHILAKRREVIREAGGITIIHDWRRRHRYDTEARQIFLERMRAREPGYLKTVVAIVGNTPFLRMAVQTANMLMALRSGGQLELALDAGEVLRNQRISAPVGRWP